MNLRHCPQFILLISPRKSWQWEPRTAQGKLPKSNNSSINKKGRGKGKILASTNLAIGHDGGRGFEKMVSGDIYVRDRRSPRKIRGLRPRRTPTSSKRRRIAESRGGGDGGHGEGHEGRRRASGGRGPRKRILPSRYDNGREILRSDVPRRKSGFVWSNRSHTRIFLVRCPPSGPDLARYEPECHIFMTFEGCSKYLSLAWTRFAIRHECFGIVLLGRFMGIRLQKSYN